MIRRQCRRVRRHLALHAGNDLGPQRALLVREHVGRCLPCARELERWRSGLSAMGALAGGHVEVESVWPGLERAIEAAGGQPGRHRMEISKGVVLGLPLVAAATLVLLWGTGADEIEMERPAGYLRPVASLTDESPERVIHQPVLVPVLWRTGTRGLRPVPAEDIPSLVGAPRRNESGQ